MFKTILVPVDIAHPERLKATIEAARQAAAPQDGKLILLHVVEQVPGYALAELPENFRESVREGAGDELARVTADLNLPPSAEIEVRDGHVYQTILEVAREAGADLIVIASHNPVVADYLLGSVAARVVRHARCSVLVLRPPA